MQGWTGGEPGQLPPGPHPPSDVEGLPHGLQISHMCKTFVRIMVLMSFILLWLVICYFYISFHVYSLIMVEVVIQKYLVQYINNFEM